MIKKPTVAFIELTCCAGCECILLDDSDAFLNLLKKINVVEFRLFEEDTCNCKNFDIAFVVGTPSTKEQRKYIKELRERSKVLVAFGNCALYGSVWASKNWRNKEELLKKVYSNPKGIDNFKVSGVGDLVKVDYKISTCPINPEEFIRITYDLLAERQPFIPQRPVCYECQLAENECLLMKGQPCLGPVTLGGCDAICLKNKVACQGCRGPLKKANFKELYKQITDMVGHKRAEQLLEIFGVKDHFFKEFNYKKNKK